LCRTCAGILNEEKYAYHIPVKTSACALLRLKYAREGTKGS
jgi:hypothetical protein